MRLVLILQTDCILCEVLADTQQKLGYLIIFLFYGKTARSMYLSLQNKYRKQYTPTFIRELRILRYTDVHEIIWKIIQPQPGKRKVNDLNVRVIPRKQKEREKVEIALDCIENIDK